MASIDTSNAKTATSDEPNVAVQRQRFLDSVGFWLSLAVFVLIFVYLIILAIFFHGSDINASNLVENCPALLAEENEEVLKVFATQISETRDFVLEISKSILLNLFLPIITALLGYLFGSKQ